MIITHAERKKFLSDTAHDMGLTVAQRGDEYVFRWDGEEVLVTPADPVVALSMVFKWGRDKQDEQRAELRGGV